MDAYLSDTYKDKNIELNENLTVGHIEHKSICRLCLSTKAQLNIFKPESEIIDKIKLCCALEICQNDGLPEHICSNCAISLEMASNFRTQCHESDKILRTKLNSSFELLDSVHVKHEIFYDEGAAINSDNDFIKEEIDCDPDDDTYEPKKIKKTKRKKHTAIQPKKKKSKEVDSQEFNQTLAVKPQRKNSHHKSNLCTICGKYFEKRSAYHAHIRSHKIEVFSCKECDKKFNRKAKLKEHLITHFGVKNIPCDECGKLFASRAYVQKHIDKVHKRLRAVECTVCMKKLADNHTLKYHMKTHTGEKEYACEICQKQFTFKLSLQYHLRTHSGEKPYSCRFCDKRFSDYKSSSDHELLHTGETPYRCPICGKGFVQLSNMKSHFRYNHKGQDLRDYPSYKKRDNKTNEPSVPSRQIITLPVPPECALGR